DIDHKMIGIAKKNAIEAGLADLITWKQMQGADLSIKTNNGYLIGNPPYGERIKDKDCVRDVYNQLGENMRPRESWSVNIMTSFKKFKKVYGERVTKKRKIFISLINMNYY